MVYINLSGCESSMCTGTMRLKNELMKVIYQPEVEDTISTPNNLFGRIGWKILHRQDSIRQHLDFE